MLIRPISCSRKCEPVSVSSRFFLEVGQIILEGKAIILFNFSCSSPFFAEVEQGKIWSRGSFYRRRRNRRRKSDREEKVENFPGSREGGCGEDKNMTWLKGSSNPLIPAACKKKRANKDAKLGGNFNGLWMRTSFLIKKRNVIGLFSFFLFLGK